MTLKPDTVLSALPAALAQDSAISAWCTTQYGRSHRVYNNIDLRNPPGEGDCPYLALIVTTHRAGRERAAMDVAVAVECGLHDATAAGGAIANLVEYQGVDNLEALRQLVQTAVVAALGATYDITDMTVDFDTVSQFPFVTCLMQFAVQEVVCLGTDPLA